MDINEILRGVDCVCGKHHECDIERVYIENGAISRLTELCGNYQKILLVADENTYGAAGKAVEGALVGKALTTVMFSGKTILIPDEQAIKRVRSELEGIDLIVGIGS